MAKVLIGNMRKEEVRGSTSTIDDKITSIDALRSLEVSFKSNIGMITLQ